MPKIKEKNNIQTELAKLETIVQWFEKQEELDLEEGLKKVREGAAIATELKGKLKAVENEFQELKKELDNGEEV